MNDIRQTTYEFKNNQGSPKYALDDKTSELCTI